MTRARHTLHTGFRLTFTDPDATEHCRELTIRYDVTPGTASSCDDPGSGPEITIRYAAVTYGNYPNDQHEAPAWLYDMMETDPELEDELLTNAASEDRAARDHAADMARDEAMLARRGAL